MISKRYSYLTHLECSRCGQVHDADVLQGLCRICASPLLARYDIPALSERIAPEAFAGRSPDLWRYHELLPVASADAVVSLGEGMTPLVPMPRLGASLGLERLYMKDEGLIPTGTFKARGAAVGVSRAAELGVRRIAMPTNGNAGAAWATYDARAQLETLVVMPRDAPSITRSECVAVGAQLYLVDGLIGDAGAIVGRAVEEGDWFDASTLKEPYRIEGKKTMGLELFEQLGWRVPNVIVYPTGGGVGLIGIYKALQELRQLGWIGTDLPRLVAVQASGCAPIVQAFEEGSTESRPWPGASTVAFGINVAKALGDFLVLEAISATQGCAVAVSDAEILRALAECAALEGAWICPEGAATIAGVRQLKATGWIAADDEVVILNTGSGLKYPETVPLRPTVLQPGEWPPPA